MRSRQQASEDHWHVPGNVLLERAQWMIHAVAEITREVGVFRELLKFTASPTSPAVVSFIVIFSVVVLSSVERTVKCWSLGRACLYSFIYLASLCYVCYQNNTHSLPV